MWAKSDIPTEARRERLGRQIVAAIPLVTAALSLSLPAQAQSPMIQGWLAANALCKGGVSDDPKTKKACARRDDLSAKLKRRGCVYHEDGDWWKCQR